MTQSLTPDVIARFFLDACIAELAALKPGNVHVFANGHRMEVTHFEAAAIAAAPHIANPELKVGARILEAVRASFKAARCNTNLGILLLCAPLAAAAEQPHAGGNLRERLALVLANLDLEDATNAFEAISHANPAGLGTAPQDDVHDAPTDTLREAMALAAHKDRIANAFDTDYADIFTVGRPILRSAKERCADAKINEAFAVTTLHMSYLARFLDSHIARKHGAEAAADVQSQALERKHLWAPVARPETFEALMKFDAQLKAKGLNPGTTADMVVATLFADQLDLSLA